MSDPALSRPPHITNAENVRQAVESGLLGRKLTWADADAIRADPRTQRDIAADYGVSRQTVGRIKQGVSWRREGET